MDMASPLQYTKIMRPPPRSAPWHRYFPVEQVLSWPIGLRLILKPWLLVHLLENLTDFHISVIVIHRSFQVNPNPPCDPGRLVMMPAQKR